MNKREIKKLLKDINPNIVNKVLTLYDNLNLKNKVYTIVDIEILSDEYNKYYDIVYFNYYYHLTKIVTIEIKRDTFRLIIDNGGWYTNTTKKRINELLDLLNVDLYIYQKNWKWYFKEDGKTIDYINKMIFGYYCY